MGVWGSPCRRRLFAYYVESLEQLKKDIDAGYHYFWLRKDRPWRKDIYEEITNKSAFKNLNTLQVVESLSRQKKDFFGKSGMLRGVQMQPNNLIRFASQVWEVREESE